MALTDIANDFFSAARAKLNEALAPVNTSSGGGQPIGGMLFDAVYQRIKGETSEKVRTDIVGKFLQTTEGKKIQSEGIRQTVEQYLPLILLGVVAIFGIGLLVGRR